VRNMFSTLIEVDYKPATKEVQLSYKIADSVVQVFRIPLSDWRTAAAQVEAKVRENG